MKTRTPNVVEWMRDPLRVRLSSGETISLYDYHQEGSDTGRCYCYRCIAVRRYDITRGRKIA